VILGRLSLRPDHADLNLAVAMGSAPSMTLVIMVPPEIVMEFRMGEKGYETRQQTAKKF